MLRRLSVIICILCFFACIARAVDTLPPSPYIQLMVTPSIDPSNMKDSITITNDIRNNKLREYEVRSLTTKIILDARSCLDLTNETSLYKKLDQLIKGINAIKIYEASAIQTMAQGRFGASNTFKSEIIFNLNYPTLTNSDLKTVFYLHEVLGALGIVDRWYSLSSTLWSLVKVCQSEKDRIRNKNTELSKYLDGFIKPVVYDFSRSISIRNNQFFANGGITGVGSGGDPIVAFFLANLYLEALKSDLVKNQLLLPSSEWARLTHVKVEGMPGLSCWYHRNGGAFSNLVHKLNDDPLTKKEVDEYIDCLNTSYQKIQTADGAFLEIINNSLVKAKIDSGSIYFIDIQIFYSFSLFASEQLWSNFGRHYIDVLLSN